MDDVEHGRMLMHRAVGRMVLAICEWRCGPHCRMPLSFCAPFPLPFSPSELEQAEALFHLRSWLQHQPQYSKMVPPNATNSLTHADVSMGWRLRDVGLLSGALKRLQGGEFQVCFKCPSVKSVLFPGLLVWKTYSTAAH